MGALLVLLAVTLGLVLFDAVRRPSLRRLAVRNIVRRPGEAALVVLGAMLGTAIICTSFVVGDTFGQSIRNIAPDKLGEIDVTVSASQPEQLLPAIAAADAGSIDGIDGAMTRYAIGATVATPGDAPGRLAEPFSTVTEIDFDAGREFGSDPDATGLIDAGPTPTGGEVVLARDLADQLEVAEGDEVEIHAYGTSRIGVVRDLVDRRGLAGFTDGGSRAYIAFVAPGTIDAMRAEGKAPSAAPPSALWMLSATGGVFDGEPNARPIFRELTRRLDDVDGIQVHDAKHGLLADADFESASIRALFTGIGGFSVIAGILLLVNIFVMLAEERKAELGVLRAVGLKRNHLVRTFGIEGAIYAAMAAVAGGIVGVGVGRVIAIVAARIQSSGANEEFALEMAFTVKPSSVIASMLIGLVISMITIWGTSVRIGRLNIIRAIREQADPPRDPRSRRAFVLAILGVVAGALVLQTGIAAREAPPTSLGPAVALFSSMVLLRRWLPERLALTIPAAIVVLYEMNAFAVFPDSYRDPAIATFVVQGVTTTAAAVVLAAANADLVASAAERIAGSSLAARLGVAYPLARRFRTGLLLAMYSLIIFTLTFMATLSHTFEAQTPRVADQMRGGFDLFVASSWTNPPSAAQIAAEPGVATVAPLRQGPVKFQTGWVDEPEWWSVSGFDQQLIDGGAPHLRSTWNDIDPDEAWALARAGSFGPERQFVDSDGAPFTPIPAIVPNFFLNMSAGPPRAAPEAGLLFDIVDPVSDTRRKLIAVGIVEGDWVGNGVFVNDGFLKEFVSPTVVARYLVKATPDADPAEVADRIKADLIPHGVDARTFHEMVAIGTSTQAGFFQIVQGYLGLGLLVGIAGLGVVMVRAVRERRRQIGMLRAMGFQASVVKRAFLLEATFIASQGIVIGIGLGLLTSWSVMTNSDAFSANDIQFSVPIVAVLVLLVVPMLASLLGVLAPATSASRVRPAIALRIAD